MSVLITLGNKIISDVLKERLIQSDCGDECLPIETFIPGDGFPPDFPGQFDIVLTDHMTLDKLPKQCFEKTKVLVMDFGMAPEMIAALFVTRKLAGVVHATTDISLLCKALRGVHRGEIWIDNETIKALVNNKIYRQARGEIKLSEREEAIARLVKEGYRNKEIASLLSISEQTIKVHLHHIFRKMHVTKRSEMIGKMTDPEKS